MKPGCQSSVQGSVVIEGLLGVPVLFLCMVFVLECERRAQYEGILQRAVCLFARQRGLGKDQRSAERFTHQFLLRGLDPSEITQLRIRMWIEKRPPRILAKLHARYAAMMHFPGKHHFEMTKQCLF